MFVEGEVIFMGDAVEVHARLQSKIILLVIDVPGNTAVAVEVVTGYPWVAVVQSFDDHFVA